MGPQEQRPVIISAQEWIRGCGRVVWTPDGGVTAREGPSPAQPPQPVLNTLRVTRTRRTRTAEEYELQQRRFSDEAEQLGSETVRALRFYKKFKARTNWYRLIRIVQVRRAVAIPSVDTDQEVREVFGEHPGGQGRPPEEAGAAVRDLPESLGALSVLLREAVRSRGHRSRSLVRHLHLEPVRPTPRRSRTTRRRKCRKPRAQRRCRIFSKL